MPNEKSMNPEINPKAHPPGNVSGITVRNSPSERYKRALAID
jgi:hypothetical protein